VRVDRLRLHLSVTLLLAWQLHVCNRLPRPSIFKHTPHHPQMSAMSLVVWNFWTAVMIMWYLVFDTQLAVIMFLTLPTFSYPFLDAWLMVRWAFGLLN
jgi:hypothetical protein